MFDSICICFVIMGILLLILGNYNIRKNKNAIKLQKNKSQNLAILVPARDESKVIEGLLKSIKKQALIQFHLLREEFFIQLIWILIA